MKISQSLLGQADKCGLALQFTLDQPVGFVRTTSGARAVGTGYHAGLQYGYEHRQICGSFPPLGDMVTRAIQSFRDELVWDHYTNTAVEKVLWDDKIPDTIIAEALITAMLHEYFLKGHFWPMDWEIVAIEHPFKLEVANTTALQLTSHGIDLVVRSPDGTTLVGEDHKTAGKSWDQGKSTPRKNNQAPMMTWAMRQIWPNEQHYRFCFGVMVYGLKGGPKFDRKISDPSAAHEAAVVKKARDVAFMYETLHVKAGMDLPANPASTLCSEKWCDFYEVCGFGRANE